MKLKALTRQYSVPHVYIQYAVCGHKMQISGCLIYYLNVICPVYAVPWGSYELFINHLLNF